MGEKTFFRCLLVILILLGSHFPAKAGEDDLFLKDRDQSDKGKQESS